MSPEALRTHKALHDLWTHYAMGREYEKKGWMELNNAIELLVRSANSAASTRQEE